MQENLDSTPDTEEVLLEFKRFSKEKQDQIRALVNYATLMGLNGKDLVSIGGKLERVKLKRDIMERRSIIESMDLSPIGTDRDFNRRWAYVDGSGVRYYFDNLSYRSVRITNCATKKSKIEDINDDYDVGRWSFKRGWDLPNVMLSVYYGGIKLP